MEIIEGGSGVTPVLKRIEGRELPRRTINQNTNCCATIPICLTFTSTLPARLTARKYRMEIRFAQDTRHLLAFVALNLDVLILDALRFRSHPAHFSLQEALEVIERVKPKRAWLTHLSHDLEYEATNKLLPANVALAYDGLRFNF